MKENYQIYLPYQFHWRPQSVGGDSQLSHKKMKTLFLSNMSKSRRLTSTFFPITTITERHQKRLHLFSFLLSPFSRKNKKGRAKKGGRKKNQRTLVFYIFQFGKNCKTTHHFVKSDTIYREKSRSQSSTFWHIREKHGFHFLMRKLGISTEQMRPPMKLIG